MKKRVLYFDILKVIAIFFVIFIHVISEYWEHLDVVSSDFVLLSFFDSISRFCVPIYLMISGALFLNESKKITISDIFKKYIPKVLIIFVFWNIAYGLLYTFIYSKGAFTVKAVSNVLIRTLIGKGYFHLYYLPIMIGFYLCLPALKQITKVENKSLIEYLIVILFIFMSLNNVIKYVFNYSIMYPILFSGYLIYFLLGYYLNTFDITRKNTKIIYLLGFIGLVITFVGTVMCSIGFGITEVFFKYISFNVVLYSSSVFLFAKNNFKSFNIKVLSVFTKVNFGMYLVHGLVLGLLEYFGIFESLDKLTIPISVIVSTIIIYVISFIVVFIMLQIPYVKNLVSLEREGR